MSQVGAEQGGDGFEAVAVAVGLVGAFVDQGLVGGWVGEEKERFAVGGAVVFDLVAVVVVAVVEVDAEVAIIALGWAVDYFLDHSLW